jgi:hypothetical protein
MLRSRGTVPTVAVLLGAQAPTLVVTAPAAPTAVADFEPAPGTGGGSEQSLEVEVGSGLNLGSACPVL